jgi:hypothetical protein
MQVRILVFVLFIIWLILPYSRPLSEDNVPFIPQVFAIIIV